MHFPHNIVQKGALVILNMTVKDVMLQKKKQKMMMIYLLILEITFHHVHLMVLIFIIQLLVLKMNMLNQKMMLDLLGLVILLLGGVRNYLIQLKRRKELACGPWLKIILERILPKFVFQFILMSPSHPYRNVLKIWNTLTLWTEPMNLANK